MIYKVITLKTQKRIKMYKNNVIAENKIIITTSDSFHV